MQEKKSEKVVKFCKTHGNLNIKQVYTSYDKRYNYSVRYRCIICEKKRRNKKYITIKEQHKARHSKWLKANRDKANKYTRRYRNKNIEKVRSWVKSLPDYYIIPLLTRTCSLDPMEIPKELIELKRQSILLKREIKKNK